MITLWVSIRRQYVRLSALLLATLASIASTVCVPMLLAKAIDALFRVALEANMEPGETAYQAVSRLRMAGAQELAGAMEAHHVVARGYFDLPGFRVVLVAVAGLILIRTLAGVAQGQLLTAISQNVVYDLRRHLGAKLLEMDISVFDQHSEGDLVSRFSSDAEIVGQLTQTLLGSLTTSLLLFVCVAFALVRISVPLALIALATAPLGLVLACIISSRGRDLFGSYRRSVGDFAATARECVLGVDCAASGGREDALRGRFGARNTALMRDTVAAQQFTSTLSPLGSLIATLTFVATAITGGYVVAAGRLSLGQLQASIQYSRMLSEPFAQMVSIGSSIQSLKACMARIDAILKAPVARAIAVDHDLDTGPAAIRFQNVGFTYPGSVAPVLRNVSFVIRPGEIVAVVGSSGAGKTTLINLLLGFYPVTSGEIRVDGLCVDPSDPSCIRSRSSVVLQEPWICSGSIAENIRYGNSTASDEEVFAAADRVGLAHIVEGLPKGYSTLVGRHGVDLSEGASQLLALARAHARRPDVLILDEATSAVDSETDREIQRGLMYLRSTCTSLVIAHRLSTIHDADRILVMKDGEIVEVGSHAQLIREHGEYRRIYEAQFLESPS